jgi:hypothetical protein
VARQDAGANRMAVPAERQNRAHIRTNAARYLGGKLCERQRETRLTSLGVFPFSSPGESAIGWARCRSGSTIETARSEEARVRRFHPIRKP